MKNFANNKITDIFVNSDGWKKKYLRLIHLFTSPTPKWMTYIKHKMQNTYKITEKFIIKLILNWLKINIIKKPKIILYIWLIAHGFKLPSPAE